MGVKFKYLLLYLNILIMNLNTNYGLIVTQLTDKVSSGELRHKRQAGYVYDKPTVSFDLPTATSIAPTQAPTVDRISMQMYYAYPVPAGGGNVAQQDTGSSSGSTAVSSGASGYSYGAQNTQVTGSRTMLSETQNTVSNGYQSDAVTRTQAVVSSGSTGYGDGRPTSLSNSAGTGTQTVVSSGSTGYGDGRPTSVSNSAVTGTQTDFSSGSNGYGSGRPITTSGSVSTSAPRYLPPKGSGGNTAGVSVTTNTQTQTISQPSESYIPPSVQNDQVTITQSANAPSPPAILNTGYLVPNSQPAPTVSTSVSGSTSQVQTQSGVVTQSANGASPPAIPNTGYLAPNSQPDSTVSTQSEVVQSVPNVPTQQYLPPLESAGGQKTISAGPVVAPASTYLPPVF